MVKEEYKNKIEQIIGEMTCPKNFQCAASGFTKLCKTGNFGIDEYLVCLEENPHECKFAVTYGKTFFCQCPLRVYLAKVLHT